MQSTDGERKLAARRATHVWTWLMCTPPWRRYYQRCCDFLGHSSTLWVQSLWNVRAGSADGGGSEAFFVSPHPERRTQLCFVGMIKEWRKGVVIDHQALSMALVCVFCCDSSGRRIPRSLSSTQRSTKGTSKYR